jgi:hypothetical protein
MKKDAAFLDAIMSFQRKLQDAGRAYRSLALQIHPIIQAYQGPILEIAGVIRQGEQLGAAGWLPHYTTPAELLTPGLTPAELSQLLETHYRDEWSAVRDQFSTSVDRLKVDDQAKDCFKEALSIHGYGYYRAVPRFLFPEVERLARLYLHDGELKGFASQRKLAALAGELDLHATNPGGLFAGKLYEKLLDHVYTKVETQEQLSAVINDPVPNRHAAIHGVITYSTLQSSINALIMCDYIFQVFSAINRTRG